MGIITDILKDIPLSAVLRERLSDQETKMATLEAENATLKKENSDLKYLVKDLRQEIQRRDDVIQKEKSHDTLLDKFDEKILLFIRKAATIDEVTRTQQISPDIAKMHLKKLFDYGLVTTFQGKDRKLYWHIKELGTKYLIEHNLITQQGVPADG
jgi:predicted RNase H-like nuclease (RuvC/YqgF family)